MAFIEPPGDAEFNTAVHDFVTYANAHLAAIGLVAGDMAPITAALTDWDAKYADHVAKQAAAAGATPLKDEARMTLINAMRPAVAKSEASGSLDDGERAALHLRVRDSIRTPVGVPTTRPVATVDTRERLRHTIHFQDETTPAGRAKPDGVRGAQIWVKIGGAPPVDPSECHFLATDTREPYLAVYDGAEGGQAAHYMLRWENTRGQTGPWSETVSATIGA